MKKLWNSFKIAFAMYSKIPMPQSEWTEENMSYAMCFFPWVGAVTGGMSYLVVLFADLLKEREISFGSLFFPAVLTVLPVLISGGIHMDGFLDTQDALSSWQSEEKRLEILKDPHVGAFAILSGCVYFILSLGIYSGVTEESMRLIGMGFILSRTLSGISVLRFPQARKNGLVAVFAERADKRRTFRVLIIYLVLEIVALLWAGRGAGLCCVIVAGLLFLYYHHMACAKFGGVTGDLAGYFLQICELGIAMAAVIVTSV